MFLPAMGMRPDLGPALMRLPVVVKQAAPLLVALGAFGAALRLARPGMSAGGWGLGPDGGAADSAAGGGRRDAGDARVGLDAGDDGPKQRPVRRLHHLDGATAPGGGALGAARRGQHPAGGQRGAGGSARRRGRGGGLFAPLHRGQPAVLCGLVRSGGADRHRRRRGARVARLALVGSSRLQL